jgi:sugar lactone lactonase YvrE
MTQSLDLARRHPPAALRSRSLDRARTLAHPMEARMTRTLGSLGSFGSLTASLLTPVLALAACTDDPRSEPDSLVLPGNAYYPESGSASADGTLFVGSIATGQVVAFTDGASEPRVVVGAGSGVTGVAGVLVHGSELFLCSIDATFQKPSDVKSFALDGTPHGTFTLGANRFCNDMAFDAAGNLYVTDSFSGTVLRLPAGGSALEPWLSDPSLAPAQPGAFGLDGIVATDGALYLTKLDTSGLYRVAIGADGKPGVVTRLTVTPALAAPDGMRLLDAHTLLVVEGGGTLAKVAVSGDTATATSLADGLDQPTAVIVAHGSAWVPQGQLGRLFAQPPQPPNLPFAVVRVDLSPR